MKNYQLLIFDWYGTLMDTQANEEYFFDSALETLQCLKQQNYILAVATSKYRKELYRILDKFNISALFSTLRCGDDGNPKPDPKMLHSLLDELTIEPHNAVMIGDSEYDMQLANNAGVDAIAVTYGVQSKERLIAYNPILCIDDIKELQMLLNQKI
jgi:phosphoglycolate phosphatase